MDDNGVTQSHEQPPEQGTLPLETAADAPISYELTARARRAVAPDSLPPLEVLPERGDVGTVVVERGDTRPARARALRRAGMPHERIAGELDVDELLVRAWCGDIASGRRGRLSVVEQPPTQAGGEEARPPGPDAEAIRAAARTDAAERLAGPTVSFVGGLGLTLARTEVSDHAALIAVADQQVAAATVRWLLDHAGVDPRRLRVVLKTAPELAADVTVHSWSAAMGMDPEAVMHTRWRGAPTGDAVEALIRIADPTVAARLAGWREALLDRLGVAAGPGTSEIAPGS